jgi:hypothetical protein
LIGRVPTGSDCKGNNGGKFSLTLLLLSESESEFGITVECPSSTLPLWDAVVPFVVEHQRTRNGSLKDCSVFVYHCGFHVLMTSFRKKNSIGNGCLLSS